MLKFIKKQEIIYILFFAMIFLVAYAPFIDNGKTLIWKVDAAGQYYPAYIYR